METLVWTLAAVLAVASGQVEHSVCEVSEISLNTTTRTLLYSPSSGDNVSSTSKCTVRVTNSEHSDGIIQLDVTSFSLGGQEPCSVNQEYLQISFPYSGRGDVDTIRWCGQSYTPRLETRQVMDITYFPGPQTERGPGFNITIITDSEFRCGEKDLMVGDQPMFLYHPGYPAPVHFAEGDLYVNCHWRVQAKAMQNVKLEVVHLDAPCSSPVLLYGGASENGHLLARLCSDSYENQYLAFRQSMYITFRYTSNSGRIRFKFRLRSVEGSDACYGRALRLVANTNKRYITSLGYPGQYPPYSDCQWRIESAYSNMSVYVEIEDAKIESSGNCSSDSLTFYDGSGKQSPQLGKLCGEKQVSYSSQGKYMFISFNSDGNAEYRGFSMAYWVGPAAPGRILTRIVLEKLKTALDKTLQNEQAGFQQDRSCTEHFTTMRSFIEQSLEQQTPLYSLLIDFQKAFENVDRDVIRRLMHHYGFPPEFVTIIQQLYEDASCQVIYDGKLTEPFPVQTGICQGCLLSPTIFLLVFNWIMRQATASRTIGIQWAFDKQLEDQDFGLEVECVTDTPPIFGSGKQSPQLGKFCGYEAVSYHSQGNFMFLSFASDGYTEFLGFVMAYWMDLDAPVSDASDDDTIFMIILGVTMGILFSVSFFVGFFCPITRHQRRQARSQRQPSWQRLQGERKSKIHIISPASVYGSFMGGDLPPAYSTVNMNLQKPPLPLYREHDALPPYMDAIKGSCPSSSPSPSPQGKEGGGGDSTNHNHQSLSPEVSGPAHHQR